MGFIRRPRQLSGRNSPIIGNLPRAGYSWRTVCMLQPDYKAFSGLAKQATLIPVVKSVTADLLTPVSAFLAVAEDEPYCCLLESVERGEQIGRYTFLGARPYMRLWAQGEEIHIERGKRHERLNGNVFE